jgi:hypothetical protein
LEDVFGVASKYSQAKYDASAPDYVPPAYHPNLLQAHGHEPQHNCYTLHYLPYEDYVPVHAEALAVKAKIPSIPGAAHILVKSPHPHVGDFRHVTAAPSLHLPPPQLHLSDPHHGFKQRQKRSAEGQFRKRQSFLVKRDVDKNSEFESDDYEYDDENEEVDDEAVDERKSFKLPSIKFKKVKLPKLPNVFGTAKNKNKSKGKGKGNQNKNKNKAKGKGNRLNNSNHSYNIQQQSLKPHSSQPQSQQQQNHPVSYNQLVIQTTSHGTEVMGTAGNSLPLCTDSNKGPGPWKPCLLPGGQRNGPGGIVVRPPPSHPIVQNQLHLHNL